MQNTPVSHQFDNRLKQLNREISDCLKDIRQHIQELAEVEQRTRPETPGQSTRSQGPRSFAELLGDAVERNAPPES